jgi:uncharacterized OsmC-like protein
MKMSASIKHSLQHQQMEVQTNDVAKHIAIPAKASGLGSSVNGGELLLLSLATCYCNDIYREAAKQNIEILDVEVIVTGKFGGEGEPGFDFEYRANVVANVSDEKIRELLEHTDKVAEVQNTLRKGIDVKLKIEN